MRSWSKNVILDILWQGARRRVAKEQPVVLAITGSVGKTTTKEALAAILQEAERVVTKTEGNLNTESGVALSLLGYKEMPQNIPGWIGAAARSLVQRSPENVSGSIYVLEYSADKPGDIGYLTRQVAPDVAVITRITPAHTQNYPDFQALVEEKLSLISGLKPGGIAVLNADDPEQAKAGRAIKKAWWYGVESPSRNRVGVWATNIQMREAGLSCTLDFIASQQKDSISRRARQQREVQLHILGTQQLSSLLAAATAALSQKVPPSCICAALEKFEVPPGRGRVLEGKKDITIIDDSYNSSPEAVKAGLSMVRDYAQKRRVVSILGSMNELGERAEEAHMEVARCAAALADYLVFVGKYGGKMLEAAKEAGVREDRIITFSKPENLFPKLDQLVKKRDVVYVKASQNGMRLERAVEKLLAHPEQAASLLTRQSNYWKQRL